MQAATLHPIVRYFLKKFGVVHPPKFANYAFGVIPPSQSEAIVSFDKKPLSFPKESSIPQIICWLCKQASARMAWSTLLSKFARLMKAADARVCEWGGNWPNFKDRPHFEV